MITPIGRILLWPVEPLDRLWEKLNRRRFHEWQDSQRKADRSNHEKAS